jgi:hypothetical protein
LIRTKAAKALHETNRYLGSWLEAPFENSGVGERHLLKTFLEEIEEEAIEIGKALARADRAENIGPV